MSLLTMGGPMLFGALRIDPHLGCNFYVEIEGLIAGQFRDVKGLDGSVDVHEFAEGGCNEYTHKIPGRTKYGNLQLSHGVTDLQTLWSWYDEVANGITYRKNITVMLLDNMKLPVMWWDIKDALPVKWAGPSLDASRGEVAVESIELIHRGISKSAFSDAVSAARLAATLALAMVK